MNLKEQLQKILGEITALSALGENLTDADAAKLEKLNAEAVKLEARIQAEELATKHKADEEARIEKEKADAVKAAREEERKKFEAQSRRPEFLGDAPYVAKYSDTYKYDQLDGSELSLMMEMSGKLNVPIEAGAY